MPKLPPNQRELLRLILESTRELEALPQTQGPTMERSEWRAIAKLTFPLWRGYGVPISGDWLGRDPAIGKRRQRGLASLDRAGFVVLSRGQTGRAVYVRLTEEGRQLAEQLTGNPKTAEVTP